MEVYAQSRFVPAAYLGPELGSRSILVSAIVGSDPQQQQLRVFRAKSIKTLSKIAFEPSLCPWLKDRRRDMPSSPDLGDDKPKEDGDPDIYPMELGDMPRTGPPKSWLLEHGRTPNCNACAYDKLHGRTHNKKCKQRYLDWLSVERAKYQSRQDNLVIRTARIFRS